MQSRKSECLAYFVPQHFAVKVSGWLGSFWRTETSTNAIPRGLAIVQYGIDYDESPRRTLRGSLPTNPNMSVHIVDGAYSSFVFSAPSSIKRGPEICFSVLYKQDFAAFA